VDLVRPDRMLALAKAIVLREQDIAGREHDIARRKQELQAKEQELAARMGELEQLRFDFSAVAHGRAESDESIARAITHRGPSIARASATVAQRVLALLTMEPRSLSPVEIFNTLELPPPIETLRATLSKMLQRGLVARPFPGFYCALEYENEIRRMAAGGAYHG
jgi:hypothetical protein